MFFRKKIKPQIMITIPEPCSETWSEMRVVDDCHRHCEACERTLTDFAQMNDDELLIFFKHAQGKICGRFRQDQLNRPLTTLPEKTSKATWWKAAALLPLTLFSKNTSAQQVIGDTTAHVQTDPVLNATVPDTVAPPVVDLAHVNDTIFYNWKVGTDITQPYYMGGVPMIIDIIPPLCLTGWTVTVDTIVTTPPKTQSAVGAEALAAAVPLKQPNAPESAHSASRFQAIVSDTAKNK
jgi:hypothetical protein